MNHPNFQIRTYILTHSHIYGYPGRGMGLAAPSARSGQRHWLPCPPSWIGEHSGRSATSTTNHQPTIENRAEAKTGESGRREQLPSLSEPVASVETGCRCSPALCECRGLLPIIKGPDRLGALLQGGFGLQTPDTGPSRVRGCSRPIRIAIGLELVGRRNQRASRPALDRPLLATPARVLGGTH